MIDQIKKDKITDEDNHTKQSELLEKVKNQVVVPKQQADSYDKIKKMFKCLPNMAKQDTSFA